MAVTQTNSTSYPNGFCANAYSADASGCEVIKAGVAGRSIYLEQITISCASAINTTIGEGETTGAVTTILIGPVVFTADGSNKFTHTFKRPLKLTAAANLTFDTSGAGAITVIAEGYIE